MVIPRTENDFIFFNQFRSLHNPVVKVFKSNGEKTIAAELYESQVNTLYCNDLTHMSNYLNGVDYFTTMSIGVTTVTSVICGTAKSYREGKHSIYRGKEFVKFYNDFYPLKMGNYSLLFMDIDYSKDLDENLNFETELEVHSFLIETLPFLKGVSILIKASSSSDIINTQTNEFRNSGKSWHVMIPVFGHTNQTNGELKELILRYQWNSPLSLGYFTLSKNNSVLTRTYLDMSVFSSERLIAIAKPVVELPYLKLERPTYICDGGILDLTKIDSSIQNDYRDVLEEKKKAFLIKNALINRSNISLSKPISNNVDACIPIQTTTEILIDEEIEKNIIEIYKYLRSNEYTDAKVLSKYLNDEVVKVLLIFLGFEVSYNFKFKLRDENTASASINYNGYINDFGGVFKGNIFGLLMEIYSLKFIEALNYIKACFGIEVKTNFNSYVDLPNPKEFGKFIKIINS